MLWVNFQVNLTTTVFFLPEHDSLLEAPVVSYTVFNVSHHSVAVPRKTGGLCQLSRGDDLDQQIGRQPATAAQLSAPLGHAALLVARWQADRFQCFFAGPSVEVIYGFE